LRPFSPEVVEAFELWKSLYAKLAYHRKRDDQEHYWRVWEQIQALKKRFQEEMNEGEGWEIP
jgi:hypothetical protein